MENKRNNVQNIFRQIGWYTFFGLFPFGTSLVSGFFLMIERVINFFQKKPVELTATPSLVKLINRLNLGFIVTIFISALLSPQKKTALLFALGFSIIFFIFIYSGQNSAYHRNLNKFHFLTLGISSILAALYSIFSYYTQHLDRAVDVFVNFNYYAYVILICIGLFIGYSWQEQRFLCLIPPFLFINTFALLLTKSRGSWLGFFAMLITLCTFKRKMIFILLIIILIFSMVFTFSHDLQQRFLSITSIDQNMGRIYIWQSTLKMIKDYPIFGVGPGIYGSLFSKYVMPGATELYLAHAHNIFLHLLAELGIPGLLFFIINTSIILYMGILLVKTGNKFYLGLLSVYIGILIQQLVDMTILLFHVSGAFWMLEGLIIGFYHQEFSKQKNAVETW